MREVIISKGQEVIISRGQEVIISRGQEVIISRGQEVIISKGARGNHIEWARVYEGINCRNTVFRVYWLRGKY